MKMLKGSANISQYRVSGDLPGRADVFEWAAKALSSWRFESISDTTDEASIGWVTANAIESSSFDEPGDLHFGDYLCFTLRFDQRKIPPAVLKSEKQKAEKAYLREHPGTKLNKAIRETIHEAVQKRLMKRCFPTIATTDALWNLGTGILTLGSQSNSAIERFTDLFGRSFSTLRLNAISPYERADLVAPDNLHDELAKANRATEESYLAFVEANTWIGNGFMMWVFHNTMKGNTQFTASCGRMNGGFTAYLNKMAVLVGEGPEDLQTVIIKGTQDDFTELRTALQSGKTITEATIFLQTGEMAWEVTVKGDTFNMGVKSPRVKKEKSDSADEQIAAESFVIASAGNMEDGIALLDSLLCSFLILRLAPAWEALKSEIKMTIDGTN